MIETHELRTIALDLANRLADLAVEEAASQDLAIHVNVVDVAGNVVVYKRMHGAALPARDFSEKKAYTASQFGFPTHMWEEALAGKPFLSDGLAQHEKMVLFGGGFPVEVDGVIIGAIGISGATEEQDVAIGTKVLANI